MKKVLLTLALAAFAFAANAQFVIGGQISYNTEGGNELTSTYVGATSTTTNLNMPGVQNAGFYENTSDLIILPKIGYQLNDNMQVGAKLGVIWSKDVDYTNFYNEYTNIPDFEGWEKTTGMDVMIAPYFRYNLMEMGNFTLFCEATLGFRFGLNPTVHQFNVAYTDPITGLPVDAVDKDVDWIKNTSTTISLDIVPGLNYKFNDNLSADLYLNVAALAFSHRTDKNFIDLNVLYGMPEGSPTWTAETTNTENTFGLRANMNNDYTLNNIFTIGFNYHF